jgi:hypothetical protein
MSQVGTVWDLLHLDDDATQQQLEIDVQTKTFCNHNPSVKHAQYRAMQDLIGFLQLKDMLDTETIISSRTVIEANLQRLTPIRSHIPREVFGYNHEQSPTEITRYQAATGFINSALKKYIGATMKISEDPSFVTVLNDKGKKVRKRNYQLRLTFQEVALPDNTLTVLELAKLFRKPKQQIAGDDLPVTDDLLIAAPGVGGNDSLVTTPVVGGNDEFNTVPGAGGNDNLVTAPGTGGNDSLITVPGDGGNDNLVTVTGVGGNMLVTAD